MTYTSTQQRYIGLTFLSLSEIILYNKHTQTSNACYEKFLFFGSRGIYFKQIL